MTESHVHVIKLIQNDRITCAHHKVKTNDRMTESESHVHVIKLKQNDRIKTCARHKVKTE